MRQLRHVPLALALVLTAAALSACSNLPSLPHDAASAAPGNPDAAAAYGQATSGQFQ